MARKGQHAFSKRQRERKKAEKAEEKRAKRLAPKEESSVDPDAMNMDDVLDADDASDMEDGPIAEGNVDSTESPEDERLDR